eukprot:CAMPEP_0204108364 /NCGR_PEP_ID=MMETSP0361-20130328/667_1 /ASSEMBLY_ACC=CAM_ASM_000343 /TAXON_ID=268821 /ORGANISM="Scrippsiella Hangoei, Strain SHTV-5" /LENGTH=87 /DNA_ID=CAMNT_0051057971 /DNA_START=33 /DNA_END=292 /DNA_ORIENTATION=+
MEQPATTCHSEPGVLFGLVDDVVVIIAVDVVVIVSVVGISIAVGGATEMVRTDVVVTLVVVAVIVLSPEFVAALWYTADEAVAAIVA